MSELDELLGDDADFIFDLPYSRVLGRGLAGAQLAWPWVMPEALGPIRENPARGTASVAFTLTRGPAGSRNPLAPPPSFIQIYKYCRNLTPCYAAGNFTILEVYSHIFLLLMRFFTSSETSFSKMSPPLPPAPRGRPCESSLMPSCWAFPFQLQ